MKASVRHAIQPIRKLRKSLKGFPSNANSDDVHSLRTQTRRVEALIAAFCLSDEAAGKHALAFLTPLRKAAGAVRDADMLIGNLFTLPGDLRGDGLLTLVDYLARQRRKQSRHLHKIVQKYQKATRRSLKDLAGLIDGRADTVRGTVARAPLQIRSAEIEYWPRLDEGNLHQFRKAVKELRYMLQNASAADRHHANHGRMETLGRVKDTAGDWHDWWVLTQLAEKLLEPRSGQPLLDSIRKMRTTKLEMALAAARKLQHKPTGDSKHLNPGRG